MKPATPSPKATATTDKAVAPKTTALANKGPVPSRATSATASRTVTPPKTTAAAKNTAASKTSAASATQLGKQSGNQVNRTRNAAQVKQSSKAVPGKKANQKAQTEVTRAGRVDSGSGTATSRPTWRQCVEILFKMD